MKRIVSAIMMVALLLTLALPVSALEFVESIEAKTVPELVLIKIGDQYYAAEVVESEAGVLEYVPLYEITIDESILEFSYLSAAEKNDAVLSEITDALTRAEQELKKAKNVEALDAGLGKDLKELINEYTSRTKQKVDANDLVVTDLFNAELIKDKAKIEPVKDGELIRFTIKPNFTKDDFFVILSNPKANEWNVVKDVKWTDDGNLTITTNKLSNFAIVMENDGSLPGPHGPDSPQTSDVQGFNWMYVGIAVLFMGAAVVFFVKAGKKRNAQ